MKKGAVFTEEHRRKMSLAAKARIRPPMSEETKRKIYLAKIGKPRPDMIGNKLTLGMKGKKSKRWKGDNVGYYALHTWIARELGKASYCSRNITHKSPRYHWANISGEYKRDLNDYEQVCPSCNRTDGIPKADRFIEGRVALRSA
jgi:hypothetical protein